MRITFALLFIASLCSAQDVPDALAWHKRLLGFNVSDADFIIEGHLIENQKGIFIELVHYGNVKNGEVLPITIRLPDPPITRSSYHNDDGKGILLTPNNKAVWFIKNNMEKNGTASLQAIETKWLVNNVLYSEQQFHNPGPWYLLPDAGLEIATLRSLIIELVIGRKKFDEAINEPDPLTKTQLLSAYIQPDMNWRYFYRALETLSTMGAAGVIVLQHKADRPELASQQNQIIITMGRSQDPSAVPYLIQLTTNARLQLQQVIGALDASQASAPQIAALNTWQIAVYALAELGDKRALPALREAATWGAQHGAQQLIEYAVRGLGAIPRQENISCFAAVFSALPRGPDGFGRNAAYQTLLALINHKYVDALPLFCSQLDHPDNYNCRQAHRGLVELVGQDLGTEPGPWMKIYDEYKKEH